MFNNMRVVNLGGVELNLYEVELLKIAYQKKLHNLIANFYDRFSPTMCSSIVKLEELGLITNVKKTYSYYLTKKGEDWIKNYIGTKKVV